jgi:predicted dehydrogenase
MGGRLLVVADVDRERAEAISAGTGATVTTAWQQMVLAEDIDVVVVAVPPKFSAIVALEAARRGKHVLCEKPLGRSPDEAAAIVAAAKQAGVVLKTGFNHRHHPAVQRAHEVLTAGLIGEPYFVRSVYGHGGRPGYDKEWRADPELAGGGELMDQGAHVLDLARWFLGDFIDVSGFATRYFWAVEPLEDNGFALLRTESGRIASLHTSWTQWKNRFSFEVIGSNGYLIIEGLGGSYGPERLTIGHRRPESGPPRETVEEFTGPDRSWHAEWQEFMSAIRDCREPLGSGQDGLESMRLVDAIYRASTNRTVVTLQNAYA